MKNNIVISSLLALALLFVSCDEKEWTTRDVELVPVYTLGDFNGGKPLMTDVYQTKSVMIEFATEVQLTNYPTEDYADYSTDSIYEFNFTALMDMELSNGVDTIIKTLVKREYFVDAKIDTISMGSIQFIDHLKYDTVTMDDMETVIGSYEMIDTVFPPVSVSVMEDEKYFVIE